MGVELNVMSVQHTEDSASLFFFTISIPLAKATNSNIKKKLA